MKERVSVDDIAGVLCVVYDHPRELPNSYVVRQHYLMRDGSRKMAAMPWMIGADLGLMRRQLEAHGLVCLGRQPEDDPVIVEVWV